MNGRLLILCAMAVAALPRPANAMDANATAGFGLGRWDYWSPGAHDVTTIPDWQFAANLSGQPFRPGLLDWQAGASYAGLRDYAPNTHGSRSAWGYRLQSALLSSTNAPIALSASRTTTTFATDTTSPQTGGALNQTGTTETNLLSGSVVVRGFSYPTLRLQGSWVDSANTPIGGVVSNLDTKIVNAGLSHSTGPHTYAVDYSSTWNHGNNALNNYRSDYVNAQFISTPRADVLFRVREYYILRTPTGGEAGNPRYEDNLFSAGVLYRPGQRWTSGLDYNFHHTLVSAPSAATGDTSSEQTAHALVQSTNFRYRPNLYFFGSASTGTTFERTRDDDLRGGNQNLALGASWQYARGRTTILSSGNGQLAALETTGRPFTLGYGIGGSEGISHARNRVSMNLTYTVSYASNAAGVGGSTVVQGLYGTTDALLGRGLQLRATLTYAQTRRDDPLLGRFSNHTATLIARAALRRWRDFYSVDLTLGESDGVSASIAPTPAAPSTGILPSAYNTQSRFLTLQATQTLLRGKLAFIEVGRLMSIEMPQQPRQHEESMWLSLRYSIGAVYLTAENRLSRGGNTGPSQVSNLFMLRLSRSFGAHF